MLKQKFQNLEKLCGMHINTNEMSLTELCAGLGFDFLWVDTEHTPIDYQSLMQHLIAARAGGTDVLVRVPWNDQILAKRVLELGPAGIIFPQINSPEELDAAMQSTLYPPYGIRGFGPIRAVKYGLDNADEYIEKSRTDMIRCVQIESKDAVKCLDKMADNPYVDCFFFGPCDLSASIGEINHVFEPNTMSLIEEAIAILKDKKKAIGVSTGATDEETLAFWYEKGVNVISAGSEYVHVLKGAQKQLETMKKIFQK